ncbi:MAG: DUF1592 domain-containing protein [Verrucomicrobiota bacterium]
MQDLLGIEMDYAGNLPADPLSEDGFFNNGAALGMSAIQLETYLQTARQAMGLVLFDGGQPEQASLPIKGGYRPRGRNLKPGNNQERLGRNHYWAGSVAGQPLEGRFTIRIKAHVDRELGQPDPVLRVLYGYGVPGLTVSFTEEMVSQVITDDESIVYEFSGWCELNPRPGKETPVEKRDGIIVIENSLDDGLPAPKALKLSKEEKSKRKDKKPVFPEDENFPQIVIELVEFIHHDYQSWPPPQHRKFVPLGTDLADREQLSEVMRGFLAQAWRRPVTNAEMAKWLGYFEKVRADEQDDLAALREVFAVGLASPEFLYLADGEAGGALSGVDLATRLSYFLWSSLPDAELRAAGESGELLKPDVLKTQFNRMMQDEKSDRFIKEFSSQWLDLGALDRVAINPQFYKGFDNDIKALMIQETQRYFEHVLRGERSALELLRSDYSLLNEKLARHYRLPEESLPSGEQFSVVSLEGKVRSGGLLGQGSVHMAGSDGAHSHPIKRAVWIRERLLHDPPKPPPPNVPDIAETVENFNKLSVRQQLEVHREKAACADCHRGIDPWGIAMEHYDAIGLHRDRVAKTNRKVESNTKLPGGVEVKGISDLQDYLVEHRGEQFAEALTAKLVTYALGRTLDFGDEAAIEHLAEQFKENDYRIQSLMEAIVTSDTFLTR